MRSGSGDGCVWLTGTGAAGVKIEWRELMWCQRLNTGGARTSLARQSTSSSAALPPHSAHLLGQAVHLLFELTIPFKEALGPAAEDSYTQLYDGSAVQPSALQQHG